MTEAMSISAASRTIIKSEARVAVFVEGGICTKEYRVPWHLRWREFYRRSRARREFENLDAMAREGLPTIEVVSWSEKRRFGFTFESTLRTRFVESAQTVRSLLTHATAADLVVAQRVGDILRRIHEAGFVCNTASPRNWLLAPAEPRGQPEAAEAAIVPTLLLCDLPLVHRRPRSVVGTKEAMVDLYAAALGESRRRETTAAWRRSFLAAYCRDDEDQIEKLQASGEAWTRRRFRFERDFGVAKAHLRRFAAWLMRAS